MKERDTVELLERLAATVEVGQAPIHTIAADGRRRERARRRWQVAGAAAVVSTLVAAGTLISWENPISGSTGEPTDVTATSTSSPRVATIAVPDVKGLSQNDAVNVLQGLGLGVHINEERTCHPPNPCPGHSSARGCRCHGAC